MSDFFENNRHLDSARLEALNTIRQTPHLDWLILTKRPEKIREHLALAMQDADTPATQDWIWKWLCGEPPSNVWLGTTVEDQERADQRIPALLRVPAAVRFLSCEPLLGPVDLRHVGPWDDFHTDALDTPDSSCRINWVIAGGESGPKARPMHPDWARGLRDQCAAAGVPFLFKQWGEWGASRVHVGTGEPRFCVFQNFDHWANKASSWMRKGDLLMDVRGVVMDCGYDIRHGMEPFTALRKLGKKAAGRLLDGVEHHAFPEMAHV